MGLLAGVNYDPGTAVSKATSSLLAMTALDTTNLRLTFTVPANGKVLVRMRGVISHGATTNAQVLLGVLEGSTVRGRAAPFAPRLTALNTQPANGEALFLVTGLTAGASLTWDAAYGVEFAVAASNLKYGGPDNAVSNDNWGGFVFEVWETPNLLAGVHYDPGTAVANKSLATVLAMTALDTTNLRLTFNAPPSGSVLARLRCLSSGGTTIPSIMLGVLDGTTVRARTKALVAANDAAIAATSQQVLDGMALVTGLTPGAALTWDAAYGVDLVATAANIKYGGPNNTTQDDAYGGFSFDVWDAGNMPTLIPAVF